MGNNSDPITLHKYLYANADPANTTDPSGYFGLVEFGVANNIRTTLANLQTDVGMNLLGAALDPDSAAEGPNAMGLGVAAIGGASAFKLLRMLSKKFREVCNSFSGDTLVSTENGLKPISEIVIGEKVWAFNEETSEMSLQEVVHLIQGEGDKEIVEITLEAGEVIRATSGHPFYVKEDSWNWVIAGQLNVGDILRDAEGGTAAVESVNAALVKTSVYNLTVDEAHTYFVGKEGVLSHNASACKPITNMNMRHILSGDKYGGGHSIHGNAINVLKIVKPPLDNKVYVARVKNSVDGLLDVKTFFPDSWGPSKIKTMINKAYQQYLGRGGKALKFDEWVRDGKNRVLLRVELAPEGKGFRVMTAHPVYK
jgi:hypothetical protein